MSGVSANCYATKWHHRRGSNRNDVDDLAKQRDLIRLCLNDREGDLAHIPCLIRLCPNGHAVALVRSLEHVHRLVGFYLLVQVTYNWYICLQKVIFLSSNSLYLKRVPNIFLCSCY